MNANVRLLRSLKLADLKAALAAQGGANIKASVEGWQDKTYARMQQGTGTLYEFRIFPESKLEPAAKNPDHVKAK